MISRRVLPSPTAPAENHRFAVLDTHWGYLAVAAAGERLRRLTFGHATPAAAVQALELEDSSEACDPAEIPHDLARRIRHWLENQPLDDDFRDVQLDLTDRTPFQRRVLAACRAVPLGHTASYADLAARAGSPQAARAVGNVMASNRFPLVIPCHRIVGSAGKLGGFSAPAGIHTKQRLLAWERGELQS